MATRAAGVAGRMDERQIQEARKGLRSLQKARDAVWDDYMAARNAAIPPEVKASLRAIDDEYTPLLSEAADKLAQALSEFDRLGAHNVNG